MFGTVRGAAEAAASAPAWPGWAIAGAAFVVSLTSAVVGISVLRADRLAKRREATLAAWERWVQNAAPDRGLISRLLGPGAMSAAQAVGLAEERPARGLPKSQEDRRHLRQAIVSVLNGMERVAVGVNLELYDLRTLSKLGGGVILATYAQFEPYIDARRDPAPPATGHPALYQDLIAMVRAIERDRSSRRT